MRARRSDPLDIVADDQAGVVLVGCRGIPNDAGETCPPLIVVMPKKDAVIDDTWFTLGMRGAWDMLILAYFVVCGVSRLARFNVTASALTDAETGKVRYFEGTPIPTTIVLVGLLGVAFYGGHVHDALWGGALRLGPATLHPLTLLYGLSGSAMISATLRIPKP